MNDPWFRRSWLGGIKPIHPRGRQIIWLYTLVSLALMPFAVGLIGDWPVIEVIAGVVFVAVSLVFWWVAFWNMSSRE